MSAVDDTDGWQLVSRSLNPLTLRSWCLYAQVKSKRMKTVVKPLIEVHHKCVEQAMKPRADDVQLEQVRYLER